MDDETAVTEAALDTSAGTRELAGALSEFAGGELDEEATAVADWLVIPPDTHRFRVSAWRRLTAVLVYDSHRHPRVVGARAVTAIASQHHRLLYEADGVGIDLEVRDSSIAGRLRMLGQVTASASNLARAWVITEGPSGRLESELDDLGQFALDGLVPGVHRMEVGLAYELIAIPAVPI